MQHVDAMERRQYRSVTLKGHLLSIVGTAAADAIVIGLTANGMLRVVENDAVHRVPAAMVRRIAVDAGNGSDSVIFSETHGRFRWPMTLLGGSGDDTLVGSIGSDFIAGGDGNDVLQGDGGDDVLRGNGGRDRVDGGAGNDNLAGNGGVDTVIGGAGRDTFHSGDAAAELVDDTGDDAVRNDAVAATAPAAPAWTAINDFTYQLQNVNLTAMGKTKFDMAIIPPQNDDGVAYTAKQIAALQHSSGGEKRVLAYLSIGEAENYLPYWQKTWDADNDGKPDKGAPSWLGPMNPDWPGDYTVRYWDPAWQKIVLKQVDAIAKQGFDGLYMDIVDAFETWGPDGNNQRPTAERDMVDFVKSIAAEARKVSGNAHFAIVPQNGEALGHYADYLAAVTAIGHEDVFYDDNTANRAVDVAGLTADLDRFKKAGKPVFIIDYPTRGANIDKVYAAAKTHGYVAYCPRRDLDQLTVNAGHSPD